VMEGLVKWSFATESLATWENLQALRQMFPLALAWGQPTSKQGGDVRVDTRVEFVGGNEPDEAVTVGCRGVCVKKPNRMVIGPELE
jgi:hypothetical protein